MKKLYIGQGIVAHVEQDEYPINPREDFDQVTTMICFHRKYKLGDKHYYKPEIIFDKDGDINTDALEADYGKILDIAKLYIYEHSGITISLSPFSCPWDSGCIGVVFITEASCNKMGITDRSPERLAKIMESEIQLYDQYLHGEVYCVELFDKIRDESLDSCGGFYGYDSAMDYIRENSKYWLEQNAKQVVLSKEDIALMLRALSAASTCINMTEDPYKELYKKLQNQSRNLLLENLEDTLLDEEGYEDIRHNINLGGI